MNDIKKLHTQYNNVVRRAEMGITTGEDIKIIMRFQLRKYITPNSDPFTDCELALLLNYMLENN
jgi:hypothetical protein